MRAFKPTCFMPPFLFHTRTHTFPHTFTHTHTFTHLDVAASIKALHVCAVFSFCGDFDSHKCQWAAKSAGQRVVSHNHIVIVIVVIIVVVGVGAVVSTAVWVFAAAAAAVVVVVVAAAVFARVELLIHCQQ